ncbi:MAG: phosphodiester glycosidase family protein, partial [Bacteroidales bacterium]|nr:phosphodiester glycosidase family protein [Bacteroidales bacterium]
MNLNINKSQSKHLIKKNGINPANVTEIGTAVDTKEYINIDKRKKINAFIQFEKILSRYKEKLITYSVEDVINNQLVDPNNSKPILVGGKTKSIENFTSENIIFLQPTRIISRKRIEVGFRILLKILEEKNFRERILKTKNLKITILVTGPIAAGHYDYFHKLLERFQILLQSIDEKIRRKIFLAFIFSELDLESFKNRYKQPIGIPELYNIASLILLPSKTEGRGLPIIEATACGTPIFCRRYIPENVYSDVIGEHLQEKDRLKVIEYDGKTLKRKTIESIIERVLFPHKFTDEILHNRKVVIKRYSLQSLSNNMKDVLYRLYLQSTSNENSIEIVKKSFKRYKQGFNYKDDNLKAILNTENRQYLAGYGKLSYMIYLKSLIDPSYFRIEEQEFRGRAFNFAMSLVDNDIDKDLVSQEDKYRFLNTVENVFNYRKGTISIRHDHSFTYRHRNKNYYPYQDYTIQELLGLVNFLYFEINNPTLIKNVELTPHFFTDWDLALLQLTGSIYLGIDNRSQLIKKLQINLPIAYFPGEHIMHELEFFVLQAVRSRLQMKIEDELDRDILEKNKHFLAKIFVFSQEKNLGKQLNPEEIRQYILNGINEELKLLYEYNILQLIPTKQWTVGIHFQQLGKGALKVLKSIKEENGFLITNRRNAVVMTDIVDIDCFHIGKVRAELSASILGIPIDSGYIQYVPAGLRTCLAFPTPIQTAKDFEKALNSKLFRQLEEDMGGDKLMQEIKKDAETKGSPINFVLQKLSIANRKEEISDLNFEYLSGIYEDLNPYNGVLAELKTKSTKNKWDFAVVSSESGTKKVTKFTKEFSKKHNIKPRLAWNGGYILNPELVGKLGIPETYIGSPLGLIISEGKMLSPPLFNKAALLIYEDGRFEIKRVNSGTGMTIKMGDKQYFSTESNYNNSNPGEDFCYYDLLFKEELIVGNGRIIVRLAGNLIKDIVHTQEGENIDLLPVGLSLSFNKNVFPVNIKIGDNVEYTIEEYKGVKHAVEAGPLLLDNGEKNIDMEAEGWKTKNSIRTQAARLDYTDMRGPKIAAGIDDKGNFTVLAINGRIRESVGASHENMAEILKKRGIIYAMGFDPGGSSTLFVDGEVKNISPYNSKYEENVFSLPPEPRAVSNAIIGFVRK